jgi:Na+-driven multidrug efflux pump
MSVVAANIGTAALAAHQIAMALWMLMSLVCDGFADVATIIGSKLMGERGRSKELIVLRDILMLFGLATGAVAGTAMWFFRDSIMEIYNVNTHSSNSSSSCNSSNSSSSSSSCSNTDTTALLVMLWPLICSMQVINAAVFVLDGFVYATQSFVFIRNLMLASVLLWFFPALAIGQSMFNHSLLAVWVAKAGLNGLRCVGACWLMFVSFPKQWNRREKNVQQLLRDRLLE